MVKLFKLNEEIDEARKYWLEALEPCEFISSDGTRLPYRLYVPPTYSPENKYPLQIHLHGGGIRGTDNSFQLYHDCKQTQMMFAYQHYEPFIFAIPQCPPEYLWSNQRFDEVDKTLKVLHLDTTDEYHMTKVVFELVEHLSEKYSVDKCRRYVSGASMGGAGSYEMLYRHSDAFAGAIIGCAVSDPHTAHAIAHIPMYLMHGADDPTIPVENSRKMAEKLRELGADFVYKEFEGRIHDFTSAPTGDAEFGDAMRWMFSKKRKD
ncbi:MAG: hypothetical protein E7491_02035 [Ruminococcaceae bacterium]|nr:hypothetical protein [Oscillospiraceae bacterium]